MRIERRSVARNRMFRGGSIIFNGRQSLFACTVRNQSETGALLRLSDWIALPSTFELQMTEQGESRRVRQCWRRGDDVGVTFLNPEDNLPPPPLSLDEARKARNERLASLLAADQPRLASCSVENPALPA